MAMLNFCRIAKLAVAILALAAAVFVPASAAPVITTTPPQDNAFGVAVNANLVATFSEPIQKGTGNITIYKADATVFETIGVSSAAVTVAGGQVTINPVNNFVASAEYYVLIGSTAFSNTVGQYYAGITDRTGWNFTAKPDLATVDGRLTWMMQQNISDPWPDPNSPDGSIRAWGLASYALAAFHLGTDLTTANDYINTLHTEFPVPDSNTIDFDSYFKLHLIWRIYHDPAMNARLTPLARTNIEDMMWRWIRTRSRLADAQGTEWVYHDSENLDAMQKGSYLLCAEALKAAPGHGPNRVLANGGTLAQHATAWGDYLQRYFIGRAREGINAEVASPTYAKYTVGVYYNLMDFAESPALRTLAERFITLYWADTASDWTSSGVRGGGQIRCYKDGPLRVGSQYSFEEILWGYGWHANSTVVRTYGLIPAASSYRVPAILTACATDPARPNYLNTSRRWGRAGGVVGADNFITFDNGDSNLRRDTWVTPAYTMGTLTFDMNRAYSQITDQNRAMGVMFASGLNDRVMVFGKGAATDDKSYADLSGVTRADCMVVQRDKNANFSGSGTLVFVAQNLWNTRVETNGWLFLQTARAYCAIRPAGGGYTNASALQGVELSLGDIWAPVIIQTGQTNGYANFAAFQASVMTNALSYVSGTLNYTSEAGDTFTFYANTKTTPRVNGTTVNLNPVKTYDSPYLSMVHGQNLATVSYPGYPNLLLNFDTSDLRVVASAASGITTQTGTSNTITGFTVAPGTNRKLVLAASWENPNSGISATWNGSENFTVAVNSAADRNSAILYLDNPLPGTGDIVVSFPVATGSRVGVLSLVGAASGVARISTTNGVSGSLNAPVDGSLVVGVYTANDWPTITGPFPTTLYNGDSGSSAGNAGYQTVLSAGLANYTWTFSAPSSGNNALAAFVPVAAAPVIVTTTPADNATNVPVAANLVATFSEPVVAGPAGTISLKRTADHSTVESFNVTSSPRLTFNGQTLTIDPTANLAYGAGYYVLIDSGAVVDTTGGDNFAGISATTAWSFTADSTGPTLVSLNPADNSLAVPVSSNLVATFSEPVVADTGNVELWQAGGGSPVESFNVTSSSRLTFSGATLTINPTANPDPNTGYYVIIPATAVKDLSGNLFGGLTAATDWNFTTVTTPTNITFLNSGYFTDTVIRTNVTTFTYTTTFDPNDNADALVVVFATEAAAPSAVVLFGSQTMTQAVPFVAANNPVGIYYLNQPSVTSQTVSVTFNLPASGNINGVGFTIMALDTPDGLGITPTATATNNNTQTPLSIDITVPTVRSFVVVGYNNNAGIGGADVVYPLAILHNGDFGSLQAAFGYDADVAAGNQTYTFTTGAATTNATSAAVAFAAVSSVTPTNTFASWISNPAFGLAPADQDLGDDPDGDGNPNGVENFFGTNPGVPGDGLVAGAVSGNTFTFTHPQNATPATDLTASNQWSKDLVSFLADGATDGSGTTVTFTTQTNTPSPGFTRVTANITGTLTSKLFFRVVVTQN